MSKEKIKFYTPLVLLTIACIILFYFIGKEMGHTLFWVLYGAVLVPYNLLFNYLFVTRRLRQNKIPKE